MKSQYSKAYRCILLTACGTGYKVSFDLIRLCFSLCSANAFSIFIFFSSALLKPVSLHYDFQNIKIHHEFSSRERLMASETQLLCLQSELHNYITPTHTQGFSHVHWYSCQRGQKRGEQKLFLQAGSSVF